jgi:Flp pilus assembly protein TadB
MALTVGWLVGGFFVSWLFSGRLIFGLAGAVPLPWVVRATGEARARGRSRALDRSALSYLYALQGLLQVGRSLPVALFELAERIPAPFATTMRDFLAPFDAGKPLHACLARFRARSSLKLSATCLALLELAYRNGLPVSPLLERILPVLESEHESGERIRSLRRGLVAQAAVAFFSPWFVGGFLFYCQPEVLQRFLDSGVGWPLAGLVVAWEGMGVLALWKVSTFF